MQWNLYLGQMKYLTPKLTVSKKVPDVQVLSPEFLKLF